MPYAGPLPAIPSPLYCSFEGVEMANPLFRLKEYYSIFYICNRMTLIETLTRKE